MADIFISHIHEDAVLAGAFTNYFKLVFAEPKPTCFASSHSKESRLGENWLERLQRELMEARVVLALLTPLSVTKPWVNFEAGAAWMNRKRLIPVCVHGLTVDELPQPYSALGGITISHKDHLEELTRGISVILSAPRIPAGKRDMRVEMWQLAIVAFSAKPKAKG